MNSLITTYKLYIDTLISPANEDDISSELIRGLYRQRDYLFEDWENFSDTEKQTVKELDRKMIELISGDISNDFREIAEVNNYSKETHWWYWLAIEPEVKKYAEAA